MTTITITDLTPPTKYRISDLSNGDFFLYVDDDNRLYVKCDISTVQHPSDDSWFYAICMDSSNRKFGKVFNFDDTDKIVPIEKVELTLL